MENENLLRREDAFSVVSSTGKGTQQGREELEYSSVKSEMNTLVNMTRQVFTCSTQGGFAFLPHGQPMPYAVERIDRSIYISVHDSENMWVQDMPMNPRLYGCVTVTDDHEGRVSVLPSNPEPCWILTEDPAFNPKDLVIVQQGRDTAVYVAKHIDEIHKDDLDILFIDMIPFLKNELSTNSLFVALSEKKIPGPPLEFLSATGYEWLKVQRGNPIPPNVVKTSLGWYIGRTGDQIPIGIIATEGLVDHFSSNPYVGQTSVLVGEILVLTLDPKITSR